MAGEDQLQVETSFFAAALNMDIKSPLSTTVACHYIEANHYLNLYTHGPEGITTNHGLKLYFLTEGINQLPDSQGPDGTFISDHVSSVWDELTEQEQESFANLLTMG